MPRRRVVVLGAGYAGLRAALDLAEGVRAGLPLEVTLVDRNRYHQLVTELHRAAAGSLPLAAAALPISLILDLVPVRFRQSEVRGLDLDARQVVLAEGSLAYDDLVVALGGGPAEPAVPGLAERALTLGSLRDAERLHTHLMERVQAAATAPAERRAIELTVALVGGGFTGVELAAELAEVLPRVLQARGLSPDLARIFLLEARPRLLPEMDGVTGHLARRWLERHGVRVVTDAAVIGVEDEVVRLTAGRYLRAATLVWSGGMRGSPLLEAAGVAVGRNGRAVVDPYLRLPGRPEVAVVGDSVLRSEPPTAQLAVRQGRLVAANLLAGLRGAPPRAYEPGVQGIAISLGRSDGIVVVMGLHITGLAAAVAKEVALQRYLYSLGGLRILAEFDRRAGRVS